MFILQHLYNGNTLIGKDFFNFFLLKYYLLAILLFLLMRLLELFFQLYYFIIEHVWYLFIHLRTFLSEKLLYFVQTLTILIQYLVEFYRFFAYLSAFWLEKYLKLVYQAFFANKNLNTVCYFRLRNIINILLVVLLEKRTNLFSYFSLTVFWFTFIHQFIGFLLYGH
jgi:hypothetical protein